MVRFRVNVANNLSVGVTIVPSLGTGSRMVLGRKKSGYNHFENSQSSAISVKLNLSGNFPSNPRPTLSFSSGKYSHHVNWKSDNLCQVTLRGTDIMEPKTTNVSIGLDEDGGGDT